MKETRYAGGQGFSGAYEAGLEMKKRRVDSNKL
jgi:hypothetical protein